MIGFACLVRNIVKTSWIDFGCRGAIDELTRVYTSLYDPQTEVVDATRRLVASRRVCIVTGFPIPPRYMPETDGIMGSIAIAYTLQNIGIEAVVATEEMFADVLKAAAEVVGVRVLGLGRSPSLEAFDTLVFVEKPGLSSDGRYLTMRGLDVSSFVIDSHTLVQNFMALGKPVIAVGDGGNEVGFGKLPPNPPVTSITPATHLIVASISDIGAYALAAVTAAYTVKDALPDPDLLRYSLKQAVAWGAVDGIKATNTESVDAVHVEVITRVYGLMRRIVEQSIE